MAINTMPSFGKASQGGLAGQVAQQSARAPMKRQAIPAQRMMPGMGSAAGFGGANAKSGIGYNAMSPKSMAAPGIGYDGGQSTNFTMGGQGMRPQRIQAPPLMDAGMGGEMMGGGGMVANNAPPMPPQNPMGGGGMMPMEGGPTEINRPRYPQMDPRFRY